MCVLDAPVLKNFLTKEKWLREWAVFRLAMCILVVLYYAATTLMVHQTTSTRFQRERYIQSVCFITILTYV